jgi:dihydroneopterin aldolase
MEINAHLLERVARRILDAVRLSFPVIISMRIKISKINPPLGGKVKQVTCILTN